ncbi:MAG: lipopolysaccharide kinase InaA family protein [Bacteroidota bacterium]
MSLPTPSQYQEALQHPPSAFVDRELQQALPEETVLGLPRALTGAFAVVFPVRVGRERQAVKCFLSEVPGQAARYAALAKHIEAHTVPGFQPFTYQPHGIRIEGQTHPLLLMPWVEGTSLNRFVEAHLDAPQTLRQLAEQWLALMSSLDAAQVAHGDLQHGNVLVRTTGDTIELSLVDYDATFVPALASRHSAEVGHRNYQHPDRDAETWGPFLDRFSALVVYIALRALAVDPSLWARYDTGENLLFRSDDFYDPAASVLFDTLAQVDEIADAVAMLKSACHYPPDALPPLALVAEGKGELRGKASRARALAEDAQRPPRSAYERWAAPALLLAVVYGAGLLAAGWSGVGGGVLAGSVAALVGSASIRHRRHPKVRRARRLRAELEYVAKVLAQVDAEEARLDAELGRLHDRLDDRLAQRLAEIQAEVVNDHLKHHFIHEAGQVSGITHKAIVRLKNTGVRTAIHITPERLATILSFSPETRATLLRWRDGLEARYQHHVPRALPSAEVQRLRRHLDHRASTLRAERGRLHQRRRLQAQEQDRLAQRLANVEAPSLTQYLGFLAGVRR